MNENTESSYKRFMDLLLLIGQCDSARRTIRIRFQFYVSLAITIGMEFLRFFLFHSKELNKMRWAIYKYIFDSHDRHTLPEE